MTSPISLVSRRWCGHRRSRRSARSTSVGLQPPLLWQHAAVHRPRRLIQQQVVNLIPSRCQGLVP